MSLTVFTGCYGVKDSPAASIMSTNTCKFRGFDVSTSDDDREA